MMRNGCSDDRINAATTSYNEEDESNGQAFAKRTVMARSQELHPSVGIPPKAAFLKLGKTSRVKVVLNVSSSEERINGSGILQVDKRKKHASLLCTSPIETNSNCGAFVTGGTGKQAPKLFAFDAIFTEENSKEVGDYVGSELIASLLNGQDGCVVSLGPATKEAGSNGLDCLKSCIQRLFEGLGEKKSQGSRFSIRISAAQLQTHGTEETIKDLLLPYAKGGDQAPGYFLLHRRGLSEISWNADSILENLTQIRVLDAAVASSHFQNALGTANEGDPSSHVVFTVLVYQCSVDKRSKKVVGGRSRLHFLRHGGRFPSISTVGGMLSAILNDQRHLPSRWTKLGNLLRECVGSFQCQTVVMVYVSLAHAQYAETLASLQLGSRIHRLRRHRAATKFSSLRNRGHGSTIDTSESKNQNLGSTTGAETKKTQRSDPSSSEQSCDTVIYVGPSGDEATDGEHPPSYYSSIRNEFSAVPRNCHPEKMVGSFATTAAPKLELSRPAADSSHHDARDSRVHELTRNQSWMKESIIDLNSSRSDRNSLESKPITSWPGSTHYSTSVTKAQLVQQWIADQARRNTEAVKRALPQGFQYNQNWSSTPKHHSEWLYGFNSEFEASEDRKPLTALKATLDLHGDSRVKYGKFHASGFHYEIIEVSDPPVPVCMKDVAVQVTDSDIFRSYCEMNPVKLNFPNTGGTLLDLENIYTSATIRDYLSRRRCSSEFSLFSSETRESWAENDSPWIHPLRVLSQECLTVVSTFADSASIASDHTLRL